MAKVFLKKPDNKVQDMIRITSSANVFGGTAGNEVASVDNVQYLDADNIFALNANVDKIIVVGTPSDYKFSASGNTLSVYKFISNVATLVGKVQVQGDADGTLIDFMSNGVVVKSCNIKIVVDSSDNMSITICDTKLTTTPLFAVAPDTTAPTATITLAKTDLKQGESAQATVTFSESVTGLSGGNFTATNCSISGLTGNGANYTMTVTAGGTIGSGSITLNANSVSDAAGNQNQSASASFSVKSYITTTITLAKTDLKQGESTTATITFSESVTGLSASSFAGNNCSISGLTGSGSNYTMTVTAGSSFSSGSITLNANSVSDAAGNKIQSASVSFSVKRSLNMRMAKQTFKKNEYPVVSVTNDNINLPSADYFTYTNCQLYSLKLNGRVYEMTLTLTRSVSGYASVTMIGNSSFAAETISFMVE